MGLLEDVARLRTSAAEQHAAQEALANADQDNDGTIAGGAPRKTLTQAAWQIVIADVSMSLDNVLAVAGAARDHPTVLVIGLILSIALMGFAATFIARLLHRYPWIAYVGLAIILYVALDMIYRGIVEIWPVVAQLMRLSPATGLIASTCIEFGPICMNSMRLPSGSSIQHW